MGDGLSRLIFVLNLFFFYYKQTTKHAVNMFFQEILKQPEYDINLKQYLKTTYEHIMCFQIFIPYRNSVYSAAMARDC